MAKWWTRLHFYGRLFLENGLHKIEFNPNPNSKEEFKLVPNSYSWHKVVICFTLINLLEQDIVI